MGRVFRSKNVCWLVFLLVFLSSPAPVFAFTDGPDDAVERVESAYNSIFIVRSPTTREVALTFGYNRRFYTESIYNPNDELELPVYYTQFMTVGLAYRPDLPKNLLEIGFGGGRTSWYLHKSLPQLNVTSVELDPVVIKLAKKYFGVREEPNFTIAESDGRRFLMQTKAQYDVILIDAYRGPFVPFHLLTKQFYELVKSKLSANGVVVQNVEPSTMLFDAALATLSAVFENVEIYPAEGNVVVVAYPGPARTPQQLQDNTRNLQAQVKLRYPLEPMLRIRDAKYRGENGKVLTDDFAPVESLQRIEVHNRKWASPE